MITESIKAKFPGIRVVALAALLAGIALCPSARATLAAVGSEGDVAALPSSYSLDAAPAPEFKVATVTPSLAIVPEPTTVLAGGLALGVLALGVTSRRRNAPVLRIGA